MVSKDGVCGPGKDKKGTWAFCGPFGSFHNWDIITRLHIYVCVFNFGHRGIYVCVYFVLHSNS